MEALAQTSDVTALWPTAETLGDDRVMALVWKASARLRQKLPSVDARIAAYAVDPTDPVGLDPDTVADVIAVAVKRFLVNPDGATNSSNTVGPFSASKGYALRGDKDVRGEIRITDDDLDALRRPNVGPIPAVRTHSKLLEAAERPEVYLDGDPSVGPWL